MDNPYYERLVNAALRFVSFRPRSEKELTEFLTKKMVKWDVVGAPLLQKVVERMRELGYIDDKKFAEWWIEQRSAFRPKGKRALIFELQNKGVTHEFQYDEKKAVAKVISKKIEIWARLPKIEQKKKVYTFLAQRGFSSETIRRVIDGLSKKD